MNDSQARIKELQKGVNALQQNIDKYDNCKEVKSKCAASIAKLEQDLATGEASLGECNAQLAAIRAELAAKAKEIEELTALLATAKALEAEKAENEKKLAENQRKIAELEGLLKKRVDSEFANELIKELTKVKDERDKLISINKITKNDLDRLTQDYDAKSAERLDQIQALEAALKAKQKEYVVLQARFAALDEALKESKESLTQQVKDLTQLVRTLTTENAKKLADLNSSKEALELAREEAAKYVQCQKNLKECGDKLRAVEMEMAKLSKGTTVTTELAAALQLQLNKIRAELKQCQRDSAAKDNTINAKDAEISRLTSTLEGISAELVALRTQVASKDVSAEEAAARCASLQAQLEECSKKLVECDAKAKRFAASTITGTFKRVVLQNKVAKLTAQNKRLIDRSKDASKRIKEARKQYTKLQNTNTRKAVAAKQELDAAQANIDRLKGELDAVKNAAKQVEVQAQRDITLVNEAKNRLKVLFSAKIQQLNAAQSAALKGNAQASRAALEAALEAAKKDYAEKEAALKAQLAAATAEKDEAAAAATAATAALAALQASLAGRDAEAERKVSDAEAAAMAAAAAAAAAAEIRVANAQATADTRVREAEAEAAAARDAAAAANAAAADQAARDASTNAAANARADAAVAAAAAAEAAARDAEERLAAARAVARATQNAQIEAAREEAATELQAAREEAAAARDAAAQAARDASNNTDVQARAAAALANAEARAAAAEARAAEALATAQAKARTAEERATAAEARATAAEARATAGESAIRDATATTAAARDAAIADAAAARQEALAARREAAAARAAAAQNCSEKDAEIRRLNEEIQRLQAELAALTSQLTKLRSINPTLQTIEPRGDIPSTFDQNAADVLKQAMINLSSMFGGATGSIPLPIDERKQNLVKLYQAVIQCIRFMNMIQKDPVMLRLTSLTKEQVNGLKAQIELELTTKAITDTANQQITYVSLVNDIDYVLFHNTKGLFFAEGMKPQIHFTSLLEPGWKELDAQIQKEHRQRNQFFGKSDTDLHANWITILRILKKTLEKVYISTDKANKHDETIYLATMQVVQNINQNAPKMKVIKERLQTVLATIITNAHNKTSKVITYVRIRCDDTPNTRYDLRFDEQRSHLYVGYNSTKDTIAPSVTYAPDYHYMFGPFTRVFGPFNNDRTSTKVTNKDIAQQCTELTDKLTNGQSVFVFGYGASGSGKTSSLVYFNKGGSPEERDGILIHLLNKITNLNQIDVSVHELSAYNMQGDKRVDNAVFTKENGQFVLKNTGGLTFTNNYFPGDGNVVTKANGTPLGECIAYLLDENRLIRSTTNNPDSSRSHVLIYMKLKLDGGREPYLIIGDFAGVENEFDCTDKTLLKKMDDQIRTGARSKFYDAAMLTYEATKVCPIHGTGISSHPIAVKGGQGGAPGNTKSTQPQAPLVPPKTTYECKDFVPLDAKELAYLNMVLSQSEVQIIYDGINQQLKKVKQNVNNLDQFINKIDPAIIRQVIDQASYQPIAEFLDKYKTYFAIIRRGVEIDRYQIKISDNPKRYKSAIVISPQQATSIGINKTADVGADIIYDNQFYIGFTNYLHLLKDPVTGEKVIQNVSDPEVKNAIGQFSAYELKKDTSVQDKRGAFTYFINNINKVVDYLKNPINRRNIYGFIDTLVDKIECNKQLTTRLKKSCECRVHEGRFINSSLAALRVSVADLIKKLVGADGGDGLVKLVPPFNNKCAPIMCNPFTDICFDEKSDARGVVDHISNDIAQKIGTPAMNSLSIGVFEVFNWSAEVENNPGYPMPYIDIQDLRSEYQRLDHLKKYSDNKELLGTPGDAVEAVKAKELSWNVSLEAPVRKDIINSIRAKVEAFKDKIDASMYGKIIANIDAILKTPEHNQMLTKLGEVLKSLENINAISPLGTLEFTDQIAKYGLTTQTCSYSNKNVVDFLKEIVPSDGVNGFYGIKGSRIIN